MVRVSRRRFIASSAAAGLAGVVLPHGAFGVDSGYSPDGRVNVKASGDDRSGHNAIILFSGQPIARHIGEGKFSAVFHNSDHSVEDRIDHWRTASYTESTGCFYSKETAELNWNANVLVQVEYKILSPQIVRKKIRFHQADMYDLLYQVTNALEPFDPPASFSSSIELDSKGGPFREPFPAVGFRTRQRYGSAARFFRISQWSNRIIRRDGSL